MCSLLFFVSCVCNSWWNTGVFGAVKFYCCKCKMPTFYRWAAKPWMNFRPSVIKSNSILMASLSLLFASVTLAILFHCATLCFPRPEVSLAVSLGSSSVRTGEKSKSSEPWSSLGWSYQKTLVRDSLCRMWRRDFSQHWEDLFLTRDC